MKKSSLLILVFIVAALSTSAQYRTPKTPDSDWVAKPILHPAPKEYENEPAVILTQSDKIEYKYEGRNTSIYHTFHRTIKLMDARGVENYGTVGIPFYTSARIEEIKARTISANGKVYDIPLHMFKESQNEDGAPEIKFALEGVSKNAEVEVFLKTIVPFSSFGTKYFQSEIPVMDLKFEMSYPKDFIIEQRGYNGFPNLQDTLITGRRHYKIHLKDIPAVKLEPFSFIYPHIMRTEWRLSIWANDYGNEKRLFTWDEYAKQLYDNIFNLPDGISPNKYFLTPNGHNIYRGDTERRVVNEFLTSIGVTGSETEIEKIIKIENGIKESINLYPVVEDHSGRLDTIISRRSATSYGYLKLFAACFAQTDVKCEIGATTNREFHLFNNSFENWNNIDAYLIYFPNQKAYLSPNNILLRFPVIPNEVLGNTGVFCKMSTPSEPRQKVADVRIIPATTAQDNYTNIIANVKFADGIKPIIDINYSFEGLDAVTIRNVFAIVLNNTRQREFVTKLLSFIDKPSDLLKYSTSNEGSKKYTSRQPFELTAKVKSAHLVEKAGGKVLLKIGELLGHHSELYENKERKLPVDLNYPHSQKSVITINLPSGYRIQNLSALKTKYEVFDQDNTKVPACSFVTDYTLKGGKLTITVNEIYSKIHYHLSDFSAFKKVVNAAADFNKLSLVLGGQ